MDNIRNNLVQIIEPYMSEIACAHEDGDCAFGMCKRCRARNLAERLIANGVTVQKWVPVEEQLPRFWPEKRRAVLVTMEDDRGQRFTTTAKYDENTGEWYEFNDRRFYKTEIFKVVAWMLKPDYYDKDRKDGA